MDSRCPRTALGNSNRSLHKPDKLIVQNALIWKRKINKGPKNASSTAKFQGNEANVKMEVALQGVEVS
jgi:hypothetical protein